MLKAFSETNAGPKSSCLGRNGVLDLSDYSLWLNNSHFQDLRGAVESEATLDKIPCSLDPNGHRMLSLPPNMEYHCFLSYKQSDALHLVGKQRLIFTSLGYKCWYDQYFPNDLSIESMLDGVAKSMCYVLFLTRDVFNSRAVREEASKAIELQKPIILLSHPKTGMQGYCQFEHYIRTAPKNMKHVFDEVEAILLQTRYFHEEVVTRRLDEKLKTILSDSLNVDTSSNKG